MRNIIFFLFLVILIAGCAKTSTKLLKDVAIDACKAECQKAVDEGTDLSNGPCLSDKIVDDWVCDIAHSPREEIDNQQENQCSAFRAGEANHFVELDENCGLINVR